MTSILLCHFPGGACFGIIALYVEAILRGWVCGPEFSGLMRVPVRRSCPFGGKEAAKFYEFDQWLAS